MVSFNWLCRVLAVLPLGTALPQGDVAGGTLKLPPLLDASIDELAAGLRARRFTSVDLVNAYIARMDEVNPQLNAITEINPEALTIARTLDKERARGVSRGPLHGLPILLKNNIATADKMNNTAGSYALLGSKVPRDATVAAKLRAAGAILLGKSNLSQWASFRSQSVPSGWSAYGGRTRGGYYPGADPGGSSSGSGVATSLGLSVASLGTETIGSILVPAENNNIVGIKPTVGLTSRALVVRISEHQDSIGPMARTVKDAAHVLQAIVGKDQADNYTSAIPKIPDYVAACAPSALRGKRFGVPRNSFADVDPRILSAFEDALQTLRDAGVTIVETNYPAWGQFDRTLEYVLAIDFQTNLPQYLGQLTANPNDITDLASLRNFTWSFPPEEYPARDTSIWDLILDSGLLPPNTDNTSPLFWPLYQQLQYMGGPGGLLGALKNYTLDAVVSPTSVAAAMPAIVGAPVITVPLGAIREGTTGNKPFGISFAGRLWSEANLIGYAYAFEQKTKIRQKFKPVVRATTELKDVMMK